MAEPRLVFVALRVRDWDASARFYSEAFGVAFAEGQPPAPHAEVSWTDGAYLHFALFPPSDGVTKNAHVGFFVDDVEASHARAVAAGAVVVNEPRDEPWGRTAAYRDLDDNLVTLTQRERVVRVAGVDIAGGGWAVVVLEGNRVAEAFRCERFAEALHVEAEVIAVDVPIGVLESGTRPADEAARRFLGRRASTIFPTPIRRVLDAPDYDEARRVAVALTGKSISKQAYSLGKYILEVEEHAERDERVIEVHPEVSFAELARRPLPPKKRSDGWAARRQALETAGIAVPAAVQRIKEPDLLDATIAAWTATRYARGEAQPLPEGHTERIGAIWR